VRLGGGVPVDATVTVDDPARADWSGRARAPQGGVLPGEGKVQIVIVDGPWAGSSASADATSGDDLLELAGRSAFLPHPPEPGSDTEADRPGRPLGDDGVDEQSDESFPASDPPSRW
jgi:hypothetical protein